nr:hypothetical protein [Tanacetum cinerariifolium]
HYRINLSQLSVIAVAKVSHFEILCRVHGFETTVRLFRCFYVNSKNKGWMSFSKRPDSDAMCYTKPLDSLKHWNDHFFWVDSFACLVSFPWHTDKNVSRDLFLKSTEFSADDYAVLVAHSAMFRKFSETFLCLIGMSRNYTLDEDTYPTFLRDDETGGLTDPTKVKVREWECVEEEARLLDSTIGRVVPLLPVASAGGHDAEIELVTAVEDIVARNVIVKRPKHLRKKRTAATDTSGSSNPVKKLRGYYRTSSEVVIGGKSSSVMMELLTSSILSAEAGVSAMPTLPFVTLSVSATSNREGDALLDYVTRGNLRTIGPAVRFVISSDSSHHSSMNASRAEDDSVIRSVVPPLVTTEAVITTSVANVPPALVPRVTDKVTHQNIANDSLLDDLHTSREVIDHLAPLVLFVQIHDMDYEELFIEFSIRIARQACLSVEVRMWTEYSLKNVAFKDEKNSLNGKIIELQSLVSAKDLELKDLNVVVSSLRSQSDGLVDQVHALETTCFGPPELVFGYEHLKERIKEFQDAQMKLVDDKVAKLDAGLLEMACHLEEKFFPHLLTTISGQRWNVKWSCGRNRHGKEGRSLTDVAAYNPNAEVYFNSVVQKLREVDFSLLVELKSHKDASVEDIMNLLYMEGSLADAPDQGKHYGRTVRPVPPVAYQPSLLLQWPYPLLLPPPVPSLLLPVDDYEVINADG